MGSRALSCSLGNSESVDWITRCAFWILFIPEEWSEGSGKTGLGDSGGMWRDAVRPGAELERWRVPGHHAFSSVRK